jgi:hypothetical protein
MVPRPESSCVSQSVASCRHNALEYALYGLFEMRGFSKALEAVVLVCRSSRILYQSVPLPIRISTT